MMESLILNHDRSFAVFDVAGNIDDSCDDLQGLFHCGTRYLSKLQFIVDGERPVFLSSTIKEHNEVLRIDEVNQATAEIPASAVHFRRSRYLNAGVLYEKIEIQNYHLQKVQLSLAFLVDSDFKDIFELRGVVRKSPKNKVCKTVEDQKLNISYEGKDGHCRAASVTSQSASRVDENGIFFALQLGPGAIQEIELRTDLIYDRPARTSMSYNQSLKKLESEIFRLKSKIGSVTTDNDKFNVWFNRSRVDLISLMTLHEGVWFPNAGVPWYNTPFGRDGLITAIQTLHFAPFIAEGVLRYLALSQAKNTDDASDANPGKILHEIREGELANLNELPFRKYYGSADGTPLFIWLAGLYYKRTGCRRVIEELWPAIRYALHWLKRYGDQDGDGFIEYLRRSKSGLENQGWKDSHDSIHDKSGVKLEGPIALCEVQAYTYQAWVQGADLALVMGEREWSEELRGNATYLRKRFNEAFWLADLQQVAMALDGKKNPSRVLSSNMGHCLAAELVTEEQADALVQKIFAPELFSGWGIRTLACTEVRYNPASYHNGSIWPHDNSLIAWGLAKYKKGPHLDLLVRALYEATQFFELQRIPELYCGFDRREGEGPTHYPVACAPQAWSVGTVFLLLSSLLGLQIDSIAKSVSFRYPRLPSFLREVHLRQIPLAEGQSLSVRCIRYANDVGFDVVGLPPEWRLTIHK